MNDDERESIENNEKDTNAYRIYKQKKKEEKKIYDEILFGNIVRYRIGSSQVYRDFIVEVWKTAIEYPQKELVDLDLKQRIIGRANIVRKNLLKKIKPNVYSLCFL